MSRAQPSKGQIRDARGRSVTQLDPVTLHVLHRTDVIEADTLHEVIEDLEPGTARRYRQMIVIVPCCIAALVTGVAALYYFSDAAVRKDLVSTLANPAIMGPCLSGGVICPWIATRQARMQRVRFAMLKHRRCPHCGYDLRGLPVDPGDQATVCPECGCAWLIDDRLNAAQLAAAQVAPTQKRVSVAILIALIGLLVLGLVGAVFLFMR